MISIEKPHYAFRQTKGSSFICLPNNYSSTASFSTISSLLTLFSKFFSSFLRSTCSLSVSHKYLALEEVYLPFRAAIPNYPTLSTNPTPGRKSTGLSPSMTSSSKELTWHTIGFRKLDYNSVTLGYRFSYWAFPCSLAVTGGIIVIFFSSAYWYA